ncbi:MAG: hypothetical protein HY290_01840 [Planctomycetia bacterium]|nr:hypothetical protein [Planctomycetia bacterium]
MIALVKSVLLGIVAGWLLAIIAAENPTGECTGAVAGLGGMFGLIFGGLRLTIARSVRRKPIDSFSQGDPHQADRLLIRAIVILALASSPIVILWVGQTLSIGDPHWITSFGTRLGLRVMGALSAVGGAAVIWSIVRWFNRRDDPRQNFPPSEPS